jgi:hypothetical protein
MAAPRKTAEPTSDKILSRRVLVEIKIDQTTVTPRAVFQHELPILEAMHGEGNAKVIDAEVADEGYVAKLSADLLPWNKTQDKVRPPSETLGLGFVFTGDPRAEFDRLCSMYGKHPEVNEPYAENVFGRFATGTFAKLLGSPTMDDLPDEQLRSLVRDYGFVPVYDKDGSEEDKKTFRAKQKQLLEAGRADLLKFADELGVTLH